MSDGEPSSIKRFTRCAARAPALSKGYEDRVEARFDFAVYGTRFAAHQIFIWSLGDFFRIRRCSSKATTRHRVFILAKIYLMSQRLCFANPSRFAFSGAPCLRKNSSERRDLKTIAKG